MSWYKMERGWQDSSFFKDEPFTERDAWIWIIGEAKFKECVLSSPNGEPVKIGRGQLYSSVRFMACKFKWSKDRVLRYLTRLEKWSMITIENATGQNLITICNYSEYQDTNDTDKDTLKDTDKDTLKDKQEEGKESKEGKKDIYIYFGEFWDIFPKQRKGSQNKAKLAYEKAIKDKRASEEQIMEGLKKYIISEEVKNGFAKGAAAWLNDDRWNNDYKSPTNNKYTKTNNNGLSKSYGSDIPL